MENKTEIMQQVLKIQ